jgi:outer membrane protein OmpA-like peptidoglycan-associated protein
MANRSPIGLVLAALVWLVLIGIAAVAYRYFVHPSVEKKLERETSSPSPYRHTVTVALDSFSGYSILRADALQERLKPKGIRLQFEDDGADYGSRLRALRDGDADLAVFTIDSLVKAGAALGSFPATIVLVIDETRGADAIVAYQQSVPSLEALNDPSAAFVLTPDSPSEFLARVAVAHFNLPDLQDDWLQAADGAEDVYKAFRAARPDQKKAYVLWEPFVSQAMREPGAHILLDSGKLSGYIVDVLVARREFLRDDEPLVREVVEAYLRTLYTTDPSSGMVDLIVRDAEKTGSSISKKEAEQLVAGIAWRNTLENYAQFGLLDQDEGLPHIEDVMARIVDVLLQTGAMKENPLEGRYNVLYYDKVLRDMKAGHFHPGRAVNILQTSEEDLEFEAVRGVESLPVLTETQWATLIPVGEMRVKPVAFARGTARLNVESRRNLTRLAEQLGALPRYYLSVAGHARAEGDPAANLELARRRADAVGAFLGEQGLGESRWRAVAEKPSTVGGAAQSVSFVIGQMPY